MKIIIIFMILFFSGCVAKCICNNPNCGKECKLQCEENKCTPGVRCCERCICDPFDK